MKSGLSPQVIRRARWLAWSAALALIAAGLARGEAATVLKRAAIICLECIGIG